MNSAALWQLSKLSKRKNRKYCPLYDGWFGFYAGKINKEKPNKLNIIFY